MIYLNTITTRSFKVLVLIDIGADKNKVGGGGSLELNTPNLLKFKNSTSSIKVPKTLKLSKT